MPSREHRELREITRYHQEIIEERARELNRIQAVLERCNIKLSSVISNINRKNRMAILKAIISGESDPVNLSDLTKGTARNKNGDMQKALHRRILEHQKKLLRYQL